MKPTPEAIKALLEYHQGRANHYDMSEDTAKQQDRHQDRIVYRERKNKHLAHVETVKGLQE